MQKEDVHFEVRPEKDGDGFFVTGMYKFQHPFKDDPHEDEVMCGFAVESLDELNKTKDDIFEILQKEHQKHLVGEIR